MIIIMMIIIITTTLSTTTTTTIIIYNICTALYLLDKNTRIILHLRSDRNYN